MRLLGDCKNNFFNNPKIVIEISPNTNYLKKLLEDCSRRSPLPRSQTVHDWTEQRACPQAAVAPPVINNGHIKS